MSTKINPYLKARLFALKSAFLESDFYRSGAPAINNYSKPVAKPEAAKHWRDVLQEDSEDEQGGGGSTAKGLRGKDAEFAKQAMRKLTRAGRR